MLGVANLVGFPKDLHLRRTPVQVTTEHTEVTEKKTIKYLCALCDLCGERFLAHPFSHSHLSSFILCSYPYGIIRPCSNSSLFNQWIIL